MYDEPDPRPVRQGHPVIAAFFTALFTTAAAFAALTVADARGLLPFLHGGARDAEVPSIVGVSVEQARDLLQARGLLLTLQAERPDATVPTGKIAGQVPLGGSRAATGTAVQAFVSSGPAFVTVPALAGSRPDDAVEQLRSRKLLAGPRRDEASATVAAGLVVGTEPAAGKPVSPETPISLVVSTGPAQKGVPKVVGLYASKAKKLIAEAGFKVGAIHYGSNDDHDEGVVLKQTPAEATPAPPGSAIDLVVNE
jgi:beta-lactam-binding protein with PASTA domain